MPVQASAPPSGPLALTMGDPAGIGLDITLLALASTEAGSLPSFVFYGCPDALRRRSVEIGIASPAVAVVTSPDEASALPAGTLAVRSLPTAHAVTAGKPDAANAAAIIAAIECAVADVASGAASAVVTNPIAKHVLYQAGFRHPGHTEFLAELAARHRPGRTYHPVMMLAADELRVVPLTIHVPLVDVPRLLTRELITDTLRITAMALRRDFGIARPRIAVCGLNPHAGESGSIGREEIDIIAPALRAFASGEAEVIGPLSADTMFHAAARRTYDAAIAMYHDQALIPIKTLAFDRGVNVTLGLPFVRTSPDHGTAFDIAGSGKANPTSLIEALRLAGQMAKARAAASTSHGAM